MVEPDQSPCERHCARLAAECGASDGCISRCEADAADCVDEHDAFLDCAREAEFDCDAEADPGATACETEWSLLSSCLDPTAGEAFSPCASNADCAEGTHCLPTQQSRLAEEPLCSPVCEEDLDCFSGCCGRLETGESVCGFPADCAPAEVGHPCFDPEDCASGDCRWGSCVAPCESDEDCGVNQLGLSNHCHEETDVEGESLTACLPGCGSDADCEFYYQDPFYTYHDEWAAVPLACVGEAGAKYCF
jgi:hypothetical protein